MGKKHRSNGSGKDIPVENFVNFQYGNRPPPPGYTPPTSQEVSPALQPRPAKPVSRTGGRLAAAHATPADPQAVKLAHRIQHFQHILTPFAAALAAKEVSSSPMIGPSSPSPPPNGASNFPGNIGAPRATLAPQKTSQRPLSAAQLARSLMGFDTLVPWEAVCGVVCRVEDEEEGNGCPICLEPFPCAPRITPCGHTFCFPCILRHLKHQHDRGVVRTCPMCTSPLVPNALKRCCLQQVTPIRAQRKVTFVRVQRERRSPLLLCPTDVHLLDSVNQFCQALSLHANHSSSTGSSSSVSSPPRAHLHHTHATDVPPLWLPKIEVDASARYSRYIAPTEEFIALHQVLDESALEERKTMLERDSERPWTLDDSEEIHATIDALQRTRSLATDPLYAFPSSRGGTVPSTTTHANDAMGGSAAQQQQQQLVDLYVDADGHQHFLHFVCLKMLRDDCEARGLPMPDTITATVLDVEEVVQSEHSRGVLKALAHVPMHATVRMCFVDMTPLVAKTTIAAFREVIDRRLQRIREAARRERDIVSHETAADEAWERYKQRRRGPAESPGVSPTLEAFAIPYDDLPCLELPVSSSYGGSHTEGSDGRAYANHAHNGGGQHRDPSSLETRQRATKGGTALEGGTTAVLSESNVAALAPQTSNGSTNSHAPNRWFQHREGGGALQDLTPTAVPAARAVPAWAPAPFVDRTGKTMMTTTTTAPAAPRPSKERGGAHLVLRNTTTNLKPASSASVSTAAVGSGHSSGMGQRIPTTESTTSLLSDDFADVNPFEELERSLASRRFGGGGGGGAVGRQAKKHKSKAAANKKDDGSSAPQPVQADTEKQAPPTTAAV